MKPRKLPKTNLTMASWRIQKVARDAVSGRFITARRARLRPGNSVIETMKITTRRRS